MPMMSALARQRGVNAFSLEVKQELLDGLRLVRSESFLRSTVEAIPTLTLIPAFSPDLLASETSALPLSRAFVVPVAHQGVGYDGPSKSEPFFRSSSKILRAYSNKVELPIPSPRAGGPVVSARAPGGELVDVEDEGVWLEEVSEQQSLSKGASQAPPQRKTNKPDSRADQAEHASDAIPKDAGPPRTSPTGTLPTIATGTKEQVQSSQPQPSSSAVNASHTEAAPAIAAGGDLIIETDQYKIFPSQEAFEEYARHRITAANFKANLELKRR